MSNLDWRTKYYGTQFVSFVFSMAILSTGIILAFIANYEWALWAALPASTLTGFGGWLMARRFTPHNAKHLSPREWQELRSALEDVPVLSVFHVFAIDKRRLEKFRYIPSLKRYLWECLSEDEVDHGRVARAVFLLHKFEVDLSEYEESAILLSDPLVLAWFRDIMAERKVLRKREHLREHIGEIRGLVKQLEAPEQELAEGAPNPVLEAAWHIALFGDLAAGELRSALDDRNDNVRESVLALMEIQGNWPERRKDLERRFQREINPSVQMAIMELLALDGRSALSILNEARADPYVGKKAEELISNIETSRAR